MGATSSHPSSDHPPSRALHVLRVIPGSPASLAGIQVFFDFIVGIEEGNIGQTAIDAQSLERMVESHEGQPLNLIVWSSKSKASRLVTIIPSRKWAIDHSKPSPSPSDAQPSLLGLSMRICEPEYALDHVWHILEILEGSPAESAGLVPYGDWIVGWSGGVLSKEGDFYDVVEQHEEKPLRVYVYSYDFDTLREVVLVPNRMWGGEGLLGCGVGYGLLHRIPEVQQTPAEKDVDEEEESEVVDGGRRESLFVPADEYPEYDANSMINGRHQQQHQHPHHQHPQIPTVTTTPASRPLVPTPELFNLSHSPVPAPLHHDHDHDHGHSHSHHDESHGHSHSHHDSHGHSHSHLDEHGHSHSHSDHDHDHDGHDHSHDHRRKSPVLPPTRPPPRQSHDHGHSHDHDHGHGHSHDNGHGHHHSPPAPTATRPSSKRVPSHPHPHPLVSSPTPPPPAVPTPTTMPPISAPVPQKIPSPLPLSGSSPPTSRTPDPRLAEYRRRSLTPDSLKLASSPRMEEFSAAILSRVGSPRLGHGFGGGRKSSLSIQSPTTPRLPTASASGMFARKVAPPPPPSREDEEIAEDGSEGEAGDGSITSVD